MRKFTIPANFGSTQQDFTIYIGAAARDDQHPLHNQAKWLAQNRGGTIPSEIMESIEMLKKLSKDNDIDFEQLVAYALDEAIRRREAAGEIVGEEVEIVEKGSQSDSNADAQK